MFQTTKEPVCCHGHPCPWTPLVWWDLLSLSGKISLSFISPFILSCGVSILAVSTVLSFGLWGVVSLLFFFASELPSFSSWITLLLSFISPTLANFILSPAPGLSHGYPFPSFWPQGHLLIEELCASVASALSWGYLSVTSLNSCLNFKVHPLVFLALASFCPWVWPNYVPYLCTFHLVPHHPDVQLGDSATIHLSFSFVPFKLFFRRA